MQSIAPWSRGLRGLATGLAVVALVGTACHSDNATSPVSTVIVLAGSVNGDAAGFSGSVSFTITGTAVTGSFHLVAPASATYTLSGSYNTGTRAIAASGGGYNFAGTYDGSSRLTGTVSGTGSGTFVAAKDASETYCGTFAGGADGVWNFSIDGTGVVGSATTSSGTVISLSGTIAGDAITISRAGGGTLATGTRSGTGANGTWDDGVGGTGTWTGTRCN